MHLYETAKERLEIRKKRRKDSEEQAKNFKGHILGKSKKDE